MFPTATTTEQAMHRSPADPKAAPITSFTAVSRSASGITIVWFLAPANACTRFPLAAAVLYTYSATGFDPTKEIAGTSSCSNRRLTTSCAPWTILSTPSVRPASRNNSASRLARSGVRSDGFRTKVFPIAIASGNIQHGTIIGKLNGVMPPTTPTG